MERTNSVISVDVNQSIGTITVNVKGAGSTTLHLERVHEANVRYAAFHGFEQRLRDRAALLRNPLTGASASPQEKLDGIVALVAHYESGSADWSVRAGATGDAANLIAALIASGLKADSAEMRAKVRAMSKVERAALAQVPAIKAELDKLAAQATTDVDTEALIAGL